MHVLAGVEHGEADVGVGERHRQIDHDLDVKPMMAKNTESRIVG